MILRLVSGSLTPARSPRNFVAGLHTLDVQAHVLIGLEHVLELVLAQQARIHEDAVEVLADGLVQQHGGHRRIDAARKPEHDLVVAQFLAAIRARWPPRNSPRSTPACSRRYPRRSFSAAACRRSNGTPRGGTGCPTSARPRCGTQRRARPRCWRRSCSWPARDVIVSPCDIHTCVVAGRPRISGSPASPTVSIARPYSRLGARLHLAAEGRCEELRAVADAQQGQFALDGRKVGGQGHARPARRRDCPRGSRPAPKRPAPESC